MASPNGNVYLDDQSNWINFVVSTFLNSLGTQNRRFDHTRVLSHCFFSVPGLSVMLPSLANIHTHTYWHTCNLSPNSFVFHLYHNKIAVCYVSHTVFRCTTSLQPRLLIRKIPRRFLFEFFRNSFFFIIIIKMGFVIKLVFFLSYRIVWYQFSRYVSLSGVMLEYSLFVSFIK